MKEYVPIPPNLSRMAEDACRAMSSGDSTCLADVIDIDTFAGRIATLALAAQDQSIPLADRYAAAADLLAYELEIR